MSVASPPIVIKLEEQESRIGAFKNKTQFDKRLVHACEIHKMKSSIITRQLKKIHPKSG